MADSDDVGNPVNAAKLLRFGTILPVDIQLDERDLGERCLDPRIGQHVASELATGVHHGAENMTTSGRCTLLVTSMRRVSEGSRGTGRSAAQATVSAMAITGYRTSSLYYRWQNVVRGIAPWTQEHRAGSVRCYG
jgi:hypothetical protein